MPTADMPRSLSRAAAVLVPLLAIASCREPSGSGRRAAALALVPQFSASAVASYQTMQAAGVDADAVHIMIQRPLTKETLADTLVRFPVTMASIAIAVVVELKEPEETLDALVQLKSGAIVLFSGSQQVRAIAGSTSSPGTPVAMQYVGPGATATSLSIASQGVATYVGGQVTLTAVAADPTGLTVGDALIAWSSLNSAVARVGVEGIVEGVGAGTTSIVARTANGLADTVLITVTAAPASLAVVSGADVIATVGTTANTPFTVRVLTAEQVAVPNAPVVFAPATEGDSVFGDTVLTDPSGQASTMMAVGRVAGPHLFTAKLGALPVATIQVHAEAGSPALLRAVAESDSQRVTVASTTLPVALAVQVTDSFGNAVALSGVTVRFAVTADPGAGYFAPAGTQLDSASSSALGVAAAPTYITGTGADQAITASALLGGSRTAATATLHVFVGPAVVPNRAPAEGVTPAVTLVPAGPVATAGRSRPSP